MCVCVHASYILYHLIFIETDKGTWSSFILFLNGFFKSSVLSSLEIFGIYLNA